jgi:hypothetical protein
VPHSISIPPDFLDVPVEYYKETLKSSGDKASPFFRPF